ncbi:MAG: Na+/H+ antiporter subunit E [Gammaproteobacteria bacterium]
MRSLSLALILFLLWLSLSGSTMPLLVGLGVASAVLCVYLARRMDVIDNEGHPVHLGPSLLTYIPWLGWQIVKSNIAVARLILDPKMPITPTVFRVRASQPDDLGKVIYANSITLTPGTVSMSIDGDEILVHSITADGKRELMRGEMDRRVTQMAGKR